MCIRKIVHHLECDSRPVFTTTLDERFYEVYVDPYSLPKPCKPGCTADPSIPPPPANRQCKVHPCCWIGREDVRCRGLAKQGHLPGQEKVSKKNRPVDACTRFEKFHVYIQHSSKVVVDGRITAQWVKAAYPDSHLVKNVPSEKHMPKPEWEFVLARNNLLKAGQRLLEARISIMAARKGLMVLNAAKSRGEIVTPWSNEAINACYSLALKYGESSQHAFNDCAYILGHFEEQGAGCIHLPALRWNHGLNVLIHGKKTEVEYNKESGFFHGDYLCQRGDCEHPKSTPETFPFAIGEKSM